MRSWCCAMPSSTSTGQLGVAERISSPRATWPFTVSNSSGVRRPCFSRSARGSLILPMSSSSPIVPSCDELGAREAQVAAEGHEVDRHLQAVAVGGDVLLAQPRHPHERVRVAHHALDHLVDDLLDAGDLHRVPGPDVGGELAQHLGGPVEGRARRGDLLLDGAGVRVDGDRDRRGQERGALRLRRQLGGIGRQALLRALAAGRAANP